ncbi:hypothetical protein V3C99_002659 [Haemonchus contortus]|uniref:NTR domain-containing protein n=1 Tax=Haemonchus contortus TaxID=6289 RepID=A0A7I4YAB1_HAECO|nr:Proteinase inhibitor I35 domain containing protein [Haemonchus contortus]
MRYLIVFIACVAASEACSCLPFNTLKETFCASDFVTHVKVIAKDDPNEDSDGLEDVEYIVEHICVYRKPANVKILPKEISTASNSAACGIELDVGQEYLLGGSADEQGVLHSYLCGLVEEWSTVSAKDRIAMETYKC